MAADLRGRLAERNAEQRSDAWSLIVLGIPFALGGAFFLTLAVWFLLILTPVPGSWAVKALVSSALVLGVLSVDVWRNPSEEWYRARYYLTDGSLADAEAEGVSYLGADGWFAGMPAMTSVADPANLAARGRAISSGMANVVLGGPRNLRKGLEKLAHVRRRSVPRVVDAAEEFLEWLGEHGPVDEAATQQALADHPEWRPGFALAGELTMLSSRWADGRKLLSVRGANRGGPA